MTEALRLCLAAAALAVGAGPAAAGGDGLWAAFERHCLTPVENVHMADLAGLRRQDGRWVDPAGALCH
ncbi:hypothetical protein DDZ14_16425 [Maritimibacter sp. 55A14]|uniref:hypothetical protein n=1 Tax=Maritimibacter sp. 55A14 TaxID=2174844 RepID=UPI000D60C05B|nr:hypothetical protein [Maritimibacter sp. 55A14]PWE29918.1 hypothetical protein DDZ14_16425 [Maritimibacter sp. 55A14]